MKTNPLPHITAGIAAILMAPAYGIEAPADDAPPPPPVAEAPAAEKDAAAADAKPAPQPEAKAATAYLGVVSAEVPQMLAEHLGLQEKEGVVVRAVMPDGPAAKAGLAVNDIITRIGDKAVKTPVDLSNEVQAHKPGETIHLGVIQKGKAGGLDVALGERPDQFADMKLQPLDQLDLNGLPKDIEDRVRGMIEGNLGGMKLDIQEGAVEIAPQLDEAMREMRKRMEGMRNGIEGRIDVQAGATFRLLDEKGSVELKSNEGGKEVTIRDKDDKIVWTGPWDTEQDKAAAPDDVRQRVERLRIDQGFNGKGLRLRMGGQPLPMDEDPE